jgi:hypothetical protein
MRRFRTALALALITVGALLALAVPAGAQQLVDAGKENSGVGGGLAFVLLVVTILCMAGALFFMDRVRRNRLPQDDDTQ